MSNHVHLIVSRSKELLIEAIIRDFKKYTSVQLCRAIATNSAASRRDWMLASFARAAVASKKHSQYMFWQNDYCPVELSTKAIMDQKLAYIHDNPVSAGIGTVQKLTFIVARRIIIQAFRACWT